MNAEHTLKTLEPGEISSSEEPVHLDFAGQTWNVAAFIGTKERSVVVLEKEDMIVESQRIVQGILAALAGFSAGLGVVDNADVRAAFHALLEQEMDEASAAFRAAKAARGKPS